MFYTLILYKYSCFPISITKYYVYFIVLFCIQICKSYANGLSLPETKKAMRKDLFISIYLDTRRPKASGKFPVKIRVFTSSPRKQMLYPTSFEFTLEEYRSIWETTKPRKKHSTTRLELQAIEGKANDAASQLNPFNFEQFEKKLFRTQGDGSDVFYQYNQAIEKLKQNKQLGTAHSYGLSMLSIKNFIKVTTGRAPSTLFFNQVSKEWLMKYEKYMVEEKQRTLTTVGIYLRPLRSMFNIAIAEKEISPDTYPFGKRKYQIPATQKVKKALPKDQLRVLFHSKPKTAEQQKAKDFWFFSYSCNGMNIKDIALLRNSDIQGESLSFYRAKTLKTSKANLKPITVALTDFSQKIIKRYGIKNATPNDFVFDILNSNDSEELRRNKIQRFTRYINQHIKKLAKAEGITEDISTYFARHSFSTNAIRSGASMEFVSEALGHSNLNTTQRYFAGFEEKDKRAMMESLMDF